MTDIAVIKINAQNLPVLPWADSSKVKVGQWVLAIGSPFALNQTVTLGHRERHRARGMGMADYEDFIQTDAAINPGNSGGGLIDAAARSSASIPRFSARAAATRASASPCRATWPAGSPRS